MHSEQTMFSPTFTMSSTNKHVHFDPTAFDNTRRSSSQSLDSIAESNESSNSYSPITSSISRADSNSPCPDGHEFVRDHTRSSSTTQTCACGKLRHSDIKHAAHMISSGMTRRESVEGFEDVKRRWYSELMSEKSAVEDETWGPESMGAAPTLCSRFGVHHW